jgi:AcrR family transcriptional regulator
MAEAQFDRRDSVGDLGPLPGGHHGLSRQQILESQRERLLAAIAHEVALRGYRATTITGVVKIASVSTRDFYEHFESKEECFLGAFAAVRDHLETLVLDAAATEPDWPHRVIAALRTSLEFFAGNPDLARLCLIESVSATPSVAIRFREAVLACAPALEQGRALTGKATTLPPSTEDSLLGGIISLITREILAGETAELPRLLPDVVEFTLSPYLGADTGKRMGAEATAR